MGAKCVPNCPEAKLLIDRKIIQKTIGKKKEWAKDKDLPDMTLNTDTNDELWIQGVIRSWYKFKNGK
jgi:hypothetical protein